jgi:hypothetical protein
MRWVQEGIVMVLQSQYLGNRVLLEVDSRTWLRWTVSIRIYLPTCIGTST